MTNGRYLRREPLSLEQIALDGPPVRLRDLIAISGLSEQTVRNDLAGGYLKAKKRVPRVNSAYLIQRREARRWLSTLGFTFKTPESA